MRERETDRVIEKERKRERVIEWVGDGKKINISVF